LPLSTNEAVVRETPARFATSSSVARVLLRDGRDIAFLLLKYFSIIIAPRCCAVKRFAKVF